MNLRTQPSTPTRAAHGRAGWLRAGTARATAVGYAPILDTERGVLAGIAATPARGRSLNPAQLAHVLACRAQRPRNTFLTVPLAFSMLADPELRGELLRPSDLKGVVFELTGVTPAHREPVLGEVAASIQAAGGLLALQADEIWHPDFEAVSDRAPKMIVIGAEWVRGIDASERRQAIVETLGQVAAQRDAWVLAAGVASTAELSTLVGLHVPLLRGPRIGRTDFTEWPALAPGVTDVLGPVRRRPPGPMRGLLHLVPTAFTMGDAAAAAVRRGQDPGAGVVLDGYGRPIGLAIRTTGGLRTTEDLLCVHVDTAARDALARANARGVPSDPLLAVDSAGRFLGVVLADDLAAVDRSGAGVRP